MKPVITVIEPEGPQDWFAELRSVADLRFCYPDGPVRPELVDTILEEAHGVIITSATSITNEQLDRASHLKIIAKCGGAPSNIDIGHASRCGIAVSCVPGANTTSIAEYTVMLIIAALRRFDLHQSVIRQGQWRAPVFLLGHDLRDAVVGIVGLGAIGKEVVKRLRAFDCRILVYSPHARISYSDDADVCFIDSLEQLLPQCDVVSLHRKVTPENMEFFDAHYFSLMKKGAVFINTARGALVNEKDLALALKSGRLSAAAVDVFQVEPPAADFELISCNNAILTPHSSGWTEEALKRECQGAVASVLAFLDGRKIPGLLNPEYAEVSSR